MDSLEAFLDDADDLLHSGRLGLLCNQVSYSFRRRDYLLRLMAARGNLTRCFLPEHGLFAELQDQIPLDDARVYRAAAPTTDFVSLYGSAESSLTAHDQALRDLDAIIVDLQDVGTRYYTFFVTTVYLLRRLAQVRPGLPVYVLDRPNPAGRQVEGTPLPEHFESFVGLPGMLHRHGLSIGELCGLFAAEENWGLDLRIVSAAGAVFASSEALFPVPPSPNMPNLATAQVYAGQCLLEGTNLSEGRGTTRPFEIFGAPYIPALSAPGGREGRTLGGGHLRPLCFVPSFHKYAGLVCNGWQVYPHQPHHSLLHSLGIIRWVREHCPEFRYRTGIYEFRSDRPAIQILLGDELLLEFLEGRASESSIRERLRDCESAWIERVRPHLRYPGIPFRSTAC